MAEHDIPSQGIGEGTASGTADTLHFNELSVDSRVSACKRLVEDVVEKGLSPLALADSLKVLRLKAGEAVDYLDEFKQRVTVWNFKGRESDSPSHEPAESPKRP